MTWILIILIYVPGSGVAITMEHISGFKTLMECQGAGNQGASLIQDWRPKYSFVCVSTSTSTGQPE